MLWRLIAAVGVLLISAAANAAEEKVVVYSGATVIDSAGGTARAGMAIVTRGEAIVSITPTARLRVPRGAEVVDVRGLYALPGLIQTHVHYASFLTRRSAEAHLRRDLFGGITAVRDMAGDTRLLAGLARSARFAEMPAPDIYYAALFAGPEYFSDERARYAARGETAGQVPWMQAIDDHTDLTIAVAMARGTGATGIKIYADLAPELVRAITAEAHRQGMKVWAHAAVFPASPLEVATAGADVMSHSCMLAYQLSATMPRAYHNRAPIDSAKFSDSMPREMIALFAEMKARGTILDATNLVFAYVDKANAEGNIPHPSYWRPGDSERITGAAYRAGVQISLGTDVPSAWDQPYPALQDEADILARIGMTPAGIIRSATIVGARAIGREREMGTLEAGKLANIVFVAKDPLADISALRTVTMTVKRGKAYRRSDYIPMTEADTIYEE